MNNAIYYFEKPKNEPIRSYAPGTEDRRLLRAELEKQMSTVLDIPLIIGGKEVRTGNTGKVVMPHDHGHVLATYHKAGEKEIRMAIDAALEAHKAWSRMPHIERMSIILKIAELLAKKYRYRINAATMLGQSKNPFQAEIDAACETIDFLRFNAYFMSQIYSDQPISDEGILNRLEYRPLEGFVFAVSPFNFTSIASNLALAPAIMGNVTLWKPATTAILSNYILMEVYKEAGLPDGVVNFLPSQGSVIGNVVFKDPMLAGIHFTGSNATFNHLWKSIGDNLPNYKSYPRIVGETGGKDFIFMHPSACSTQVATAIVRGAFEYQGQKCSAASRAYLPASKWPKIKDKIQAMLSEIKMGDVDDFGNFVNAVIDENAFDSIMSYVNQAKPENGGQIIFGGKADKSKGYFIEPTLIQAIDPKFVTMQEELFGPVITVYVYEDEKYDEALQLCESTSPYGLTGAVFSRDRQALIHAADVLRYSAGNFYLNDKPTGAVVGQQPFGGARGSGTNDKAGSYLNLIRWTSPRTIKETFVTPVDYKYPFLSSEE
jgi:1-pyrroline-5-carboxylate dehydrogenase